MRLISYSFKYTLFITLVFTSKFANSQFSGGVGDGNALATALNTQNLGRNIFLGGIADGNILASTINTQNLGQNIFLGGNGDGNILSTTLNSQNLGQDIFLGGNGDGNILATTNLQMLGQNIFLGGIGYGNILATTLINQDLGQNIFKGGIGKGIAMSFPVNVSLPVTLVSFDAAWQNNDVITKWITSTESNTDHFEIERSIDGNNFITVGNTKASGTSTTTKNYSFLDIAVNAQYSIRPPRFYYRLKTIDRNGSFQYSAIVVINNLQQQDAILYTLYPNPANKQLVVECKNLTKQYSLRVLSVAQQVLLEKGVASQKEIINVSTYPSGIYFVQVTDLESKSIQTFKILVQH